MTVEDNPTDGTYRRGTTNIFRFLIFSTIKKGRKRKQNDGMKDDDTELHFIILLKAKNNIFILKEV